MIKKQVTAWLMIFLMINLSISVFGVSGTVTSASGSDGIDKVLRQEDSFLVEVDINDAPANLTADKILFIGPETQENQFNSCSSTAETSFHCSYNSNPYTFSTPQIITSIAYISPLGQKVGLIPILNFQVDSQPPTATTTLPKLIGGNQSFEISYLADDNIPGSGCSGIQRIEFYILEEKLLFDTITFEEASCQQRGTITKESDELAGAEGNFPFFVKAFDFLGHESEFFSTRLTADVVAPEFDPSSFKITKNNVQITHVGPNGITGVTLTLDILASDLNINSVVADLTGLHTTNNYQNLPGSCTSKNNDITTCTWSIDIKIEESSSPITINAEDLAGNLVTITDDPGILVDLEIPSVADITTDFTNPDGVSLLSASDNTLTLNIRETTSGIDKSQVSLDLSGIGSGSQVFPESCSDGWTCTFPGISASNSGLQKIKINPSSTDKAGNQFAPFETSILVDPDGPKVSSVNITPIGGQVEAFPGFLKTGDSLSIRMLVNDVTGIQTATLDFSGFSTSAEVAGECSELTPGKSECIYVTPPIDKQGPFTRNLQFSLVDNVGNTGSHSIRLEILGLETTELDLFTNKVSCSPKLVDRQVTTLINQRIFCHVQLEGEATPIQTRLLGCEGHEVEIGEEQTTPDSNASTTLQNSRTFFQTPEIMNNELESKDLYIKFDMNKLPVRADSLPLTCQLGIISKTGQSITGIIEKENVSIDIKFYNMPLGELGQEVNSKIKQERDDVNNKLMKTIGAMNKFFEFAQKLCNFYYTFNSIYQTFTRITTIISLLADGLKGFPTIGDALDATAQAQGLGTSNFGSKVKLLFEPFNKFCKFISCRLYFDEIWSNPTNEKGEKSKGYSLGQFQKQNLAFFGSLGGTQILSGASGIGGDLSRNLPNEIKPEVYMNPKDSLILSAATLCVPGIIHNLNKYRNIKCQYIGCLENSAYSNYPIQACEEIKEFAKCKYIYGEVFKVLGGVAVFDYLTGIVKNALSDPLAVVDVAATAICKPIFAQKGTLKTPGAICLIEDMISLTGDVIGDITGVIDSADDWSMPRDYCDEIFTEEEIAEAEETQAAASSTTSSSRPPQGTQDTNTAPGSPSGRPLQGSTSTSSQDRPTQDTESGSTTDTTSTRPVQGENT